MRRLRAGRALRRRATAWIVVGARRARDRAHGARVLRARQRVHAAAQRGRAPLHADRAARHVDRRGRRASLQAMDRELQEVPEVVQRVRQDGPRRDADRSGAARRWPRRSSCSSRATEWRPGITWDALIAGDGREAPLSRACRTSGGCRSRRAPRCSRPACAARSASRCSATTSTQIEQAAIAIEHAVVERCPARAARSPSARPAASTSTSTSTATRPRATASRVADVNTVVETAIGGDERLARPSKAASATRSTCATRASSATTPRLLGRVLVADAGRRAGAARRRSPTIKTCSGPPMIRSEGGKLVGFVFVDTDRADRRLRRRGEARSSRARCTLPAGTRLAWVGQFKYFERAKARLAVGRSAHARASSLSCST